MPQTALFHRVLYRSQLAPGLDYTVLASIAQTARRRNTELSVGGVLLFDGHRFSQLLEGPAAAVHKLMASIALDRRHTDVVTLYDQPVAPDEVQTGWTAGYCEVDDFDLLETVVGGEAALERFRAICRRADLFS